MSISSLRDVSVFSLDMRPRLVSIRFFTPTSFNMRTCSATLWGEPLRLSLAGVVGRLVRKGAHARLVLSVSLINQAVTVEVDAADVKPY